MSSPEHHKNPEALDPQVEEKKLRLEKEIETIKKDSTKTDEERVAMIEERKREIDEMYEKKEEGDKEVKIEHIEHPSSDHGEGKKSKTRRFFGALGRGAEIGIVGFFVNLFVAIKERKKGGGGGQSKPKSGH